MKFYVDDSNNTINILQSVASASTMISSVATQAKEYILSKFPKNFFKHVYVDTSETVVQQNLNDKYNQTANKIPYPSMTITPEISLDDTIAGMQKGMHLSSPNLYLRKDLRKTYNKIVVDNEKNFGVYYTSDYITTNFNFKIVTNSFIQNVDTAFYLQSKFQKDFFQFLNNQRIQSEIPKSFIKAIAHIKKFDLNTDEGLNDLRLYLIGRSVHSDTVKKRVNLATGKQCFFINERSNFLTMFTDLDAPSSINRESQVEGEYVITFRFQVSCWVPNAFIFSIHKNSFYNLTENIVKDLENEENQQENGFASISITFPDILSRKDVKEDCEDNNKNKYVGVLAFNETYMYDTNKIIPSINLMERMKPEFLNIHKYAKDKLRLDFSTLIYPIVKNGNGILEREKDYIFDFETMKVKEINNINSDILVIIYINRTLYESIKKAIEEDKNYFNSGVLTNLKANICGKEIDIVIKNFENKRDINNSDIEKSLRIQTAYGVGYISLNNVNDEDGYRICIGYDKDNNPIIRKFETA